MTDEEMLDQMFRRAKKFAGAMTLDDIETLLESQQAEIERLRAVITRAKDALLDGQSTQWVHDLLVAALVEPKP